MGNEPAKALPPARLNIARGGHSHFGTLSALPALVCVLLATGLACSGRDAPRPVPARRVVSLAPGLTDLVFAVGAGGLLVGRTRWDRYPPAAGAVPSVGDGLWPNVEAVAARRPDLVLLYASPTNASALAQFARLGIATLELPFDRLADLPPAARALGSRLGRTAAAEAVALAHDAWLAAASPEARWRVAFVVADAPLITIGAGSFLSEVARRAGAANVFADLGAPSPAVSLEALAQRNPDAVVVLAEGSKPPSWLAHPEWRVVQAVRKQRVVVLDGPHFAYPSVRAPEATRELRAALERLP